jgi:soluble lytic murein transglycosylase
MWIDRRSLFAGLSALLGGGTGLSPLQRTRGAFAQSSGSDPAAALRVALGRVGAGDWDGALEAVRPAGMLAGDVVRWHWLRASQGRLADYEDFTTRRADWPGMPLLRARGEKAAANALQTGADPARIVAYFGTQAPDTAAGALTLVQALTASGQTAAAQSVAIAAWADLSFDDNEKEAMLRLAGPALAAHH